MKICEGLELDPKTFNERVRTMRYQKPMNEAAARLDTGAKKKINRDLEQAGFSGRKRFRKMGDAVTAAMKVLNKHGLEQDEVLSTDLFRSHNRDGVKGGRAHIQTAFSDKEQGFSPTSITNSGLAMSWTELDGGVEVIAYMS
jgi:hypothetical protein